MTNADRAAGAILLRRLREARGWSWSDLARALRDAAHRLAEPAQARQQVSSVQRTVARWESLTDRTSPGERYQFLLAHLYARTPNGTVALGPGSDFAALLDALRHFGTPFVRLQLLLTPIVGTCRRLLRANQTSPREHLLLLATNAYALSARLAFETRDDVTAMSLYAEAAEAAGGLADRSSLAAVRTSHTMVVLHATGDLAAAGRIAKAATIEAHRGASYAIRARAHAVHAEISARAGQPDQAASALDRAWKTADQSALDDPRGFNVDHLNGFEGLCALHLGNTRHAHDRLERSAANLGHARDAVQRGIVDTNLALARLRLGDPTACVELLHRAVDVTAQTGGRVPARRIQQVRRDLRPWRAEDFVAELDDHIHDMLIGR